MTLEYFITTTVKMRNTGFGADPNEETLFVL